MVRAKNDEKITHELIDQKKILAIMKRFCGSKANDQEVTKFYMVEYGLNYYATNLGSSVDISFTNNFVGTYNPLKETYYTKPVKDAEKVSQIDQYVEVKDGKKKKLMRTGHYLQFPDVKGIFDKFDLDTFGKVTFKKEEFDEIISLHETMATMEKLSGSYFASALKANNEKILFTVYDTPFKFLFEKSSPSTLQIKSYFYNPNYMVNIFKSLKDLDVDKVEMYMKQDEPILFKARNTEYTFKFSMHRKLVKK